MFECDVDRLAGNVNISHSGKKWAFIARRKDIVSNVYLYVYVTSLLDEMIRLCVYACISVSVCLHTCCMNWRMRLCVQLCVCMYILCNRLAPMWGSKSIIPATFTYHFTELYVECKQRLSLHANEPPLHKDSIQSKQGVLPAHTPDYTLILMKCVMLHCHSWATMVPFIFHFPNDLPFLEPLLELWPVLLHRHVVNLLSTFVHLLFPLLVTPPFA